MSRLFGLVVTPIARVSSRDAHDATHILDCGAQGVMVLHVSNIAEAKAVENADAIAAIDSIDMLHIGSSDLSTEMGIPGKYRHQRMRRAFATTARGARARGKSMGWAACAATWNSRPGSSGSGCAT